MFYLHPSQARIVTPRRQRPVARARRPGHRQDGRRAAPRAPPRPRRARRDGAADDVRQRAAVGVGDAARALRARRGAAHPARARSTASCSRSSPPTTASRRFLGDDERRKLLEELCRKLAGLRRRDRRHGRARRPSSRRCSAGAAIATLEDYLALERPGPRPAARRGGARARCGRRGSAIATRSSAPAARTGRCCGCARSSSPRRAHGPRFDAIIVDEAQDLTEVQVRLLMALDRAPDHRDLMFVGDGQQSIYPGGFTPALGRARRARPLVPAAHQLAQHAGDRGRRRGRDRRPRRSATSRTRPARDRTARRRCRAGAASCPSCTSSAPTTQGDEVLRRAARGGARASSRPPTIAVLGRTRKAWQRGERALRALGVPTRRHHAARQARRRRARRGAGRARSRAARASSSSS